MASWKFTFGAFAAGLVAITVVGPLAAGAPPAVITIRNFAFTPVTSTTQSVGTPASGTWVNMDEFIHHPHSDVAGCFDAGITNANGGVRSANINCLGAVPYHCHVHPFMTGVVTRQN